MKIKSFFALVFCLLISLLEIINTPVSGQQIKINSGTFLNYSGAYIAVDGKIVNAGTIKNNGLLGLRAIGNLQNSGTFIGGVANHKIGGNFSNTGTFDGATSTITCNGTAAQMIESSSAITFNDLIIDNAAGVTLISDALITVSHNLTVNGGAKFEIGPGKQLTVDGFFNNNGILNLKSDATGIFSLMMSSYSGTGTANVNIYLTGGGNPNFKWHYVTVPANYINDKSVFTSINALNLLRYDDSIIPDGSSHSNYEGWVWHDGWTTGTTGLPPYNGPSFSDLDIERGYNFYHNVPEGYAVAVFSNLASLQTSLGPLSLQYSGGSKTNPGNYGFNLLGNSLTCGIDWDLVIETGDINNAVFYTIDSKMGSFIRNVAGINGATKDIPPLQGFFVKANAAGTSLNFSGAKEHTSQQRYKGEDVTTIPLIKLELNNSGNQDETLVWFNEKATNSFDGNFDASKLFSSEAGFDQIYTWFGSEKFGINGIPFPARTIIIPVAVKFLRSGSDYKIIASQLQGLDDYLVTLTDKGNANLTVNLKNTDRYTFSSEAGTFTDRFFLTITNIFTDIPDIIVPDKVFNLFVFNKILNIELLTNEWEGRSSTISIYDLTGRKVLQQNNVEWYKGERKQISLNNLPGIYIVEIKAVKQKFVSRIVII
jgi:hypothetical protein